MGLADVLQGPLDLMILQTVATMQPLHGYAIAQRLEQVSNGAIHLNMGSPYPGLLRLEQRGFIRSEWNKTENNHRARFYSMTAAGRQRLAAEKSEWTHMASIMQAVLTEEAKWQASTDGANC